MKKLFAIISFVYLVSHLPAQTVIWTGNSFGHNHLWGDKDNWSTGIVPGPSDDVLIENDSVIVLNVNPEISSLKLDSAILLNQKQMTLTNSDTFGILSMESKIYNQGIIQMDEVGENESGDYAFQLDADSYLINDSLINIADAKGNGLSINSSDMVNNGILRITSERTGLSVRNASTLINSDSIFLASNDQGASLSSTGVLTNNQDGFMEVSALKGFRLINFSVLRNYGIIRTFVTSEALAINKSDVTVYAGTMELNASLIGQRNLFINMNSSLTIFLNAHIESSAISSGLLDIETGGIFHCNGTITFQN